MAGRAYRSGIWGCLLGGAVIGLGSVVASEPRPYADGPPAGHTGGFGEPTCHQCHADRPINDVSARLRVAGVPTRYVPGTWYTITLGLRHAEMGRAGFQLAARYIDPGFAGTQAGTFRPVDDRVQIQLDSATSVQYVAHTQPGTSLSGTGEAIWTVQWLAPATAGTITIHVAANAANDDDSEFGDVIVAQRLFTRSTYREP